MKKCWKCGETKSIDMFGLDRSRKDGRAAMCKQCLNKYSEEWKRKNPEKAKEVERKSKKKHSEKTKKRNRLNYAKNKSLYKEKNLAKKNLIVEYRKRCYERRKADPVRNLAGRLTSSVRNSLVVRGYEKKSKTKEILGCSFSEFKKHIERQFFNGMCWERIGEIHIDHIVPISSAKTEEEVLALFHFTNLRPLWSVDNLKKSGRIEFLI